MARGKKFDAHVSEVINRTLVILLLFGALLAIAGLYAVDLLSPKLAHLSRVLEGLSIAVLTVALTGIAYEVFLRRHVAREVLTAVNISRDVERAGIIEFARDCDIDWDEFLGAPTDNVEICFISGRSWSDKHAAAVLKGAAQRNKTVTLTLVDDDAVAVLGMYADVWYQKTGPEYLRSKVQQTLEIWQNALVDAHRQGLKPDLRMERIKSYYPTTFYRVGDQMWVVLGVRTRQKAPWIPALRCVRTGHPEALFDWIVSEMERCRFERLVTQLVKLNPVSEPVM